MLRIELAGSFHVMNGTQTENLARQHAWGSERILTHLESAKKLYAAQNDLSIHFPPPRFISSWISQVCNLSCSYCFFSDSNEDKTKTYIGTKRFISWLQEARDFGAESLEFSGGGEPTLHPEFTEIFIAASMMGYHLGLITHACNDMPIHYLVENFKYIRCGLDAATTGTHDLIKRNKRKNYWFPKAIENIKELVRLRDELHSECFTVGIKIVLNSINYHELDSMVGLAKKLGVNYIQIKREHSSDHDLTEGQIAKVENRLGYYASENMANFTQVKGTMLHARATAKCFMSPIHTVVIATGKILQCCFFESRPIGTIFEPFREVWGSTKHREVMAKTTIEECDQVDCRFSIYNRKMKDLIEDPLASASFI